MKNKPDQNDFMLPAGDLWVFGYGSLMWKPGFEFIEAHQARLQGYRRALCVWSIEHRGTPEQPGLVFGLDQGGCCIGRVFRVAEADKWPVWKYLQQREMVTAVYRPRLLPVRFDDRVARALTFTVDRQHRQYAGNLDADRAAEIVSRAQGYSGPNTDYLINTVDHLAKLDIRDRQLDAIRSRLD